MTVACGDSHTSTHGAFGAIAFGIGTSQVRDVLASQSLAMNKLKVRRIRVDGTLSAGVYAKDLILHIIRVLGVKGGVGFAYEFAGSAIEALSMEERMTLCNMAIEGGARCGYVNPDQVTSTIWLVAHTAHPVMNGIRAVSGGAAWPAIPTLSLMTKWSSTPPRLRQPSPGASPGQGLGVDETVPSLDQLEPGDRPIAEEAYRYMDLQPGSPIDGVPVDVCFIGSCTNGRLSDLKAAAAIAQGRQVAEGIKAFVVPGSEQVQKAAEAEGLHTIFREAGFEWREPGCSMCLDESRSSGRTADQCKLQQSQFQGRQGSASGRTLLMSPAMVPPRLFMVG